MFCDLPSIIWYLSWKNYMNKPIKKKLFYYYKSYFSNLMLRLPSKNCGRKNFKIKLLIFLRKSNESENGCAPYDNPHKIKEFLLSVLGSKSSMPFFFAHWKISLHHDLNETGTGEGFPVAWMNCQVRWLLLIT